jgi:hypothetical protein
VSKDTGLGKNEGLSSEIIAPGQITGSVVSTMHVVVPDSGAVVIGWGSSWDGSSIGGL